MGEHSRRGVRLTRDTTSDSAGRIALDALHDRVLETNGDVAEALRLAVEIGVSAPLPGQGATGGLWEILSTIAAADVTVARVIEPHLDALAILAQAALDPSAGPGAHTATRPGQTWGVFAAESPGLVLEAHESAGGWILEGDKPWCSLADRLTHALVTAHTEGGHRRLFAVDLAQPGIRVQDVTWASRGLSAIPSGPVEFDGADARPVGDDEWYLRRAGFAWGGLGVAAVWWGASIGVARAMLESPKERDLIAYMHLGAVDVGIESGRLALSDAAAAVDAGIAGREASIVAGRTRTLVACAAEDIIRRCGHALGPAPLASDERHAGRVADLGMYLRQHHAERDEAAIGRAVAAGESAW